MTQNTLNIHNLSITASLAKIEGSVIAEKALHKMAVCNSSFLNFDITDDALSFAWIVVMSELTPLQKELVEASLHCHRAMAAGLNQFVIPLLIIITVVMEYSIVMNVRVIPVTPVVLMDELGFLLRHS